MREGQVARAARRQARVAIASLGGASITLLMPAPPIAGDVGEELGLRSPEFQALQLAPVSVRRTAKQVEVRVPADALEASLGVSGGGAIAAAIAGVASAQVGDTVFAVTGLETVSAGGGECLYRLLLRASGRVAV